MQKVYLLLRNNQQSGPYTLDEILQLELKPFDLVWVEGRSAAWRYPSEIDSLKAYVPETPVQEMPFLPISTTLLDGETGREASAAAPGKSPGKKKIFVSMPGGAHQSQAEQTSYSNKSDRPAILKDNRSAINFQATSGLSDPKEEEPVQTRYARSLDDVEESYTNWMYNKKTKKKKTLSPRDMGIAALVVLVIIGGYLIMSKPALIQPANNQVSVQKNIPVLPAEQEGNKEVKTETSEPFINEGKINERVETVASRKKKQVPTYEETASAPDQDLEEITVNEPITKEEPVQNADATNDSQEVVQPKEKKEKKKLGEVLRGIFSRKEAKEQQDEPVSVPDRKSTKRNSSSEEQIDLDHVASQVELHTSGGNNWMMGIQDMKLTLRNRSGADLQTANVIVSYFDNNNRLLEKKTVVLNQVRANTKSVQPIPNHKFADHVELQLGSIKVKEERYAGYR